MNEHRPIYKKGSLLYATIVALHQHFCYTSAATEVAIYLEWWVSIKHVSVCATIYVLYGTVRVFQFQLILN